MPQYVRFEIYIPVQFTAKEIDARTTEVRYVKRVTDPQLVTQFINEATAQYRGITQANPIAPALFKGWWQKDRETSIEVDFLTYVFGLVRIDQSDEALAFFTLWKNRFELYAWQDVILLLYYPVQTVGDFF